MYIVNLVFPGYFIWHFMMKTNHIALFFTLGTNLQTWESAGILERELRPYQEMIRKGYRFTFFTYGQERLYPFLGPNKIKIVNLGHTYGMGLSRITDILFSFIIPFFLKAKMKDIDLIKSNQLWGAWIPAFLKLLYHKPFIARAGYDLYEFHLGKKSHPLKKILVKLICRFIYQMADQIVVTTKKTKNFVATSYGIHPEKIIIQPNYINTSLFSSASTDPSNKRLIYIGRLDEHKQLEMLLHACKKAEADIDFVGSGELKDKLVALAKELGLTTRFLGNIPNQKLPDILQKYNFFALVSKSEGHPKALLEAMSCGLCPIGTNVPGIREIISDGVNGHLTESNMDDLARTIRHAITNYETSLMLGQEARNFVVNNCSLEAFIALETALYQRP